MAVPQLSPSPWAKWASPAENSAPSTHTGSRRRVPAVSCLMSTLPPCSRGGTVRSASAAMAGSAGTAPAGLGQQDGIVRSAGGQVRLPGGDRRQQVAGRGDADDAHERGAGDPHAGQVVRRRPAVGQLPADQVGVGEVVAQEPEPGDLGREPERLRDHLQDLGHQQVARLGAGHEHRPGERVDQAEVDLLDVLRRWSRRRRRRRTCPGCRAPPRRRARSAAPGGCRDASGCGPCAVRRPGGGGGRSGSRASPWVPPRVGGTFRLRPAP